MKNFLMFEFYFLYFQFLPFFLGVFSPYSDLHHHLHFQNNAFFNTQTNILSSMILFPLCFMLGVIRLSIPITFDLLPPILINIYTYLIPATSANKLVELELIKIRVRPSTYSVIDQKIIQANFKLHFLFLFIVVHLYKIFFK